MWEVYIEWREIAIVEGERTTKEEPYCIIVQSLCVSSPPP